MRIAALPPFVLVLLLFVHAPLEAQDSPPVRSASPSLGAGPGQIAGRVTDSEGQALQQVAIAVRSTADSSIVSGAMTASGGAFRVDGLALGGYTLRVSLIGYRPRLSEVIELTEEAPAADLGAIVLDIAPVELDAIEAQAERAAVVVEADRTVYNTKAMPAAAGTAIDVLRAVPELEVDVNDNVKLRGNQSVAVHMNGRPTPLSGEQLANFLRQLPGDRIDRVEVMPNPSAKHDPEGSGGIVNIVLNENLDLGLSGSLSANASTANRQYFNGRLNYQRGRLTLFTGAGVGTHQNLMTNYDLRHNLAAQPVTVIEQHGRSDNQNLGGNLDWTAELKISERSHLWSNAWMYGSRNNADGVTEYGILDAAMSPQDRYDRINDAEFFWGNMDISAGFVSIVERQKEELRIDGRFSSGANDSDTRNIRLFLLTAGAPVDLPDELTLNEIDQRNGNLSIQADYFRPVGQARLDAGYRAWRRDQDNDNLLRIFESMEAVDPRDRIQSGYDYEEVFHSFYATFAQPLGKFNIQAGLRAELATTHFTSLVTGDEFDRDYNSLFPSFNVAYTPRQGRTLRFQYSRRISRPPAQYLNPVVPSTDPLNVFNGNPGLSSSYTNSYSMDASWTGRAGTLRVAPFYRKTHDMWERIRTVDTLGIATSRWENGAFMEQYGSNFTISLGSNSRLSGSTNFSLYRDVRDGSNLSSDYHSSSMMWSLYGSLGYKLTPTLTAQTYATYFPTQSILQGRSSGYTYTSLGIRQQVWGTKGSISLNVNDPLNLYKFNSSTSDATYTQSSRSNYKSRIAMLGFTYNFGKPPERLSRTGEREEPTGETIRVP